MTGIERLSEVVRELGRFSFCYDLYETLGNIADQIEREQDAMVADSPYDALPPDERDAIAWVREHGGVDAVKAHWEGYVPASWLEEARRRYELKRDRLKAHAWELERKCAERRERIRELSGKAAKQSDEIRVMRDVIAETCARLGVEGTGSTVDDAQVIWREISRRLMPEDMTWPRYESGELVQIGDDVVGSDYGERIHVDAVKFHANGFTLHDKNGFDKWYESDDRFERPTPKVLDADGAEICEKRDVWWICEGDERGVHAERLRVETICPNGLIECSPHNGGTWVYLEPSELYVNKPVPAADGKPLHEGETVWYEDGTKLMVLDFLHEEDDETIVKVSRVSGPTNWCECRSLSLTHERPESWERLEEDADGIARLFEGVDEDASADIRDLVRRAKALAGDA